MLNVKYLIPEANTLHENVQRSVPEWGLSCANLKLRDDIRNRKDTDAPWSFLSPDLLWQLSFDTCRSNAGDIFHLEIYHLAPTVHSFGREKKKKVKKAFEIYGRKKYRPCYSLKLLKAGLGKDLLLVSSKFWIRAPTAYRYWRASQDIPQLCPWQRHFWQQLL